MAFFSSAVDLLQTLVIALGAGLGIWGVVNLMEGYGNDNPGAKSWGVSKKIRDYASMRYIPPLSKFNHDPHGPTISNPSICFLSLISVNPLVQFLLYNLDSI